MRSLSILRESLGVLGSVRDLPFGKRNFLCFPDISTPPFSRIISNNSRSVSRFLLQLLVLRRLFSFVRDHPSAWRLTRYLTSAASSFSGLAVLRAGHRLVSSLPDASTLPFRIWKHGSIWK